MNEWELLKKDIVDEVHGIVSDLEKKVDDINNHRIQKRKGLKEEIAELKSKRYAAHLETLRKIINELKTKLDFWINQLKIVKKECFDYTNAEINKYAGEIRNVKQDVHKLKEQADLTALKSHDNREVLRDVVNYTFEDDEKGVLLSKLDGSESKVGFDPKKGFVRYKNDDEKSIGVFDLDKPSYKQQIQEKLHPDSIPSKLNEAEQKFMDDLNREMTPSKLNEPLITCKLCKNDWNINNNQRCPFCFPKEPTPSNICDVYSCNKISTHKIYLPDKIEPINVCKKHHREYCEEVTKPKEEIPPNMHKHLTNKSKELIPSKYRCLDCNRIWDSLQLEQNDKGDLMCPVCDCTGFKIEKLSKCKECGYYGNYCDGNSEFCEIPSISCKTCENAKIIVGFEEDPICTIDEGIECARKETWRSYKFNNNKVNFSKEGLKGMIKEVANAIEVQPTPSKCEFCGRDLILYKEKLICGHGCMKPAMNPKEPTDIAGSARQTEERLCIGCSDKFDGGVHAYMCGTCANILLNEQGIIVKRESLKRGYDLMRELRDIILQKIPFTSDDTDDAKTIMKEMKQYLGEEKP